MEPRGPLAACIRDLIKLPQESGERLEEEWSVVRRRIETVHGVPVSYEAEPAGAPRLDIGLRSHSTPDA
jgi:hypothetical protein